MFTQMYVIQCTLCMQDLCIYLESNISSSWDRRDIVDRFNILCVSFCDNCLIQFGINGLVQVERKR